MARVATHWDSDMHLVTAAQRLEAVATVLTNMIFAGTTPDSGMLVALLRLVEKTGGDLVHAGVELAGPADGR